MIFGQKFPQLLNSVPGVDSIITACTINRVGTASIHSESKFQHKFLKLAAKLRKNKTAINRLTIQSALPRRNRTNHVFAKYRKRRDVNTSLPEGKNPIFRKISAKCYLHKKNWAKVTCIKHEIESEFLRRVERRTPKSLRQLRKLRPLIKKFALFGSKTAATILSSLSATGIFGTTSYNDQNLYGILNMGKVNN